MSSGALPVAPCAASDIVDKRRILRRQQTRVVFNEASKVILVPSRREYQSAGLISNLWWTGSDYFNFQQSANSEIMLLSMYENVDIRNARRILYQPNETDNSRADFIHSACASTVADDYDLWSNPKSEMANDEDDDDAEFTYIKSITSSKETPVNSSSSSKSTRNPSTISSNDNDDTCKAKYVRDDNAGSNPDVQLCVPQKEPGTVSFEPKPRGHRRRKKNLSSGNMWKSVGYTVSTSLAFISAACLMVMVFTSRETML
jgi:hypothetical protein